MAEYQLTATDSVVRTADSANIPNDPANRDWVEYQKWLAEGGVPDPYVPPLEIDPGLPGGGVIPDEPDPEAQRANARLDAGVDAAQASVDGVIASLEAMPIEALQTQVLEFAEAVKAMLYAHDETPPP